MTLINLFIGHYIMMEYVLKLSAPLLESDLFLLLLSGIFLYGSLWLLLIAFSVIFFNIIQSIIADSIEEIDKNNKYSEIDSFKKSHE